MLGIKEMGEEGTSGMEVQRAAKHLVHEAGQGREIVETITADYAVTNVSPEKGVFVIYSREPNAEFIHVFVDFAHLFVCVDIDVYANVFDM